MPGGMPLARYYSTAKTLCTPHSSSIRSPDERDEAPAARPGWSRRAISRAARAFRLMR
jgi:hypothetical protein